MSNCIYCKTQLSEDSPIEVCLSCGHKVWGEKMFQAILDNMENARESGDLHQGSVTTSEPQTQETKVEEPSFSEDTEYREPSL